MDKIELQATPRTILGKRVKQLRRRGITPVNVYGNGIPSMALQVESRPLLRALMAAGKSTLIDLRTDAEEPRKVIVRDIQVDPRTRNLLHVDFYQVKLTEKVRVEVPLHLVGAAPAAARGGVLLHLLSTVEVECLPQDMPHSLEVDISGLEEFDQSVHVKEVPLPKGVVVLADPEEMVVKVEPPRKEEEMVVAEEKVERPTEEKAEGPSEETVEPR